MSCVCRILACCRPRLLRGALDELVSSAPVGTCSAVAIRSSVASDALVRPLSSWLMKLLDTPAAAASIVAVMWRFLRNSRSRSASNVEHLVK